MKPSYQRILLLGAPLAAQMLYFPFNQFSQGGITPNIPLDAYIPLRPVWALPYLLALVWWCGTFLYAALKMDEPLYRMMIYNTVGVIFFSVFCYALFPTYVVRPELTQSGGWWELLRWIYSHDGLYNALPSGHAYLSTLIVIYYARWKPNLTLPLVIWLMVIIFSALFTHQHYILDLVVGSALAGVSYLLAIWIAGPKKSTSKRVVTVAK